MITQFPYQSPRFIDYLKSITISGLHEFKLRRIYQLDEPVIWFDDKISIKASKWCNGKMT